ncbi:unnamed protein product [Phaeothamnion confervicola]
MEKVPTCVKDAPGGPAGEEGYLCSDWTWASTQFAEDTIYVSQKEPCGTALSPNMIVNERCDPETSFGTGTMGLTVFGYEDSVFTITAQTVGQQAMLVGGMAQHGTTVAGVLCNTRDATGGCTTASHRESGQVAYYAFQVSLDDVGAETHVAFDIEPSCAKSNDPQEAHECRLRVFINSCRSGDCGKAERFPSPWQHGVEATVTAGRRSAIFIAHDSEDPGNGYCEPTETEACFYYLTLLSDEPTSFLITASTPNGVSVLRCHGLDDLPDGLLRTPLGLIGAAASGGGSGGGSGTGAGQKRYEMCAQPKGSFAVSLEVCSAAAGAPLLLYACDGTCGALFPTAEDFTFSSNGNVTCVQDTSHIRHCYPSADDTGGGGGLPGMPALTVTDPRTGTYFVSVVGDGSYVLQREWLAGDGSRRAPAMRAGDGGGLKVSAGGEEEAAVVTFADATIEFNGETRHCGEQCIYTVYALPGTATPLATPCGLEHAAGVSAGGSGGGGAGAVTVRVGSATPAAVGGLVGGFKSYSFGIVARCDWSCMAALFPATCLPLAARRDKVCQAQAVAYALAAPGNGGGGGGGGGKSGGGDSGGGSGSSAWSSTSRSLVWVAAALAVVAALLLAARRRRQRMFAEQAEQYELIDVRGGGGSRGDGSRGGSGGGGSWGGGGDGAGSWGGGRTLHSWTNASSAGGDGGASGRYGGGSGTAGRGGGGPAGDASVVMRGTYRPPMAATPPTAVAALGQWGAVARGAASPEDESRRRLLPVQGDGRPGESPDDGLFAT